MNHCIQASTVEPLSAAQLPYPSKLFVETTTRCNLNCAMCVKQAPDSDIGNDHMTPKTFARLEPAFAELQVLILNGIGEPLLNPHLESFIKAARKHMPESGWIGFQSNGLLLNQQRAITLMDAGLNGICLSLDAISPETFRKVRQGGEVAAVQNAFTSLQLAQQQRPASQLQIGVEFVVRQDNLQELPEVIEWAAKQGVNFAIVSQLMPYAAKQIEQRAYDNVSDAALTIFDKWQRIAADQGLEIRDYQRTAGSVDRQRHRAIAELVKQMKAEARDQEIFFNVRQLFERDENQSNLTARVFAQAIEVATQHGLELRLPSVVPLHERSCTFVEDGGAFISWDGKLHPCYNLWHGYRCYIEDWERTVSPKSFGNICRKNILEIWNQSDFIGFRQNVLSQDYPYCSNCSVAPCDYIESDELEQDCFLSTEPCGACLWSMGLLQCLQ